jgi:hypothetical protein
MRRRRIAPCPRRLLVGSHDGVGAHVHDIASLRSSTSISQESEDVADIGV